MREGILSRTFFYTFGIVNRSKNDIFIERGIDFAVFFMV